MLMIPLSGSAVTYVPSGPSSTTSKPLPSMLAGGEMLPAAGGADDDAVGGNIG